MMSTLVLYVSSLFILILFVIFPVHDFYTENYVPMFFFFISFYCILSLYLINYYYLFYFCLVHNILEIHEHFTFPVFCVTYFLMK